MVEFDPAVYFNSTSGRCFSSEGKVSKRRFPEKHNTRLQNKGTSKEVQKEQQQLNQIQIDQNTFKTWQRKTLEKLEPCKNWTLIRDTGFDADLLQEAIQEFETSLFQFPEERKLLMKCKEN